MSPSDKKQISARLSESARETLKAESEKLGLSQTEYLERLIDGTIPNVIEAKIESLREEIEALRLEIEKLRKEIKK